MAAPHTDQRIVYCTRGVWWDSIYKAARGPVPLCPHCRAPLLEMANEEAWMSQARAYNVQVPGYSDMMLWAKGKHFTDIETLYDAYRQEHKQGGKQ